MKTLFIIDTRTIDQEPLGLMHIAALLKQHGHECEALDLAVEKDLVSAVRKRNPNVVAFSAVTGPHRGLVQASWKIKQALDVLSIFGGPHPSYFSELIENDGVDIVCRGEGEYPMLELAEALEAGNDFSSIPNLWVKQDGQIHRNPPRPFIHDLDCLPWPDRDLFESFSRLHIGGTRYFMGGRGCPYNCAFCFNHLAKSLAPGRYVRWRSVENLVAELKAVEQQYDMRFVKFQDDIFGLKIDWLEEFAVRYRQEVALPFLCHVRADLVTDHMSQVLADAGCVYVAIGLETGDDYMRNVILNKNISRQQLIHACDSLKAHNLKVITQNMFGLPFETIDAALDTIELNIACRPEWANIYFCIPYPGTRLAQLAINAGLCPAQDVDSLPEAFTLYFSSVNLALPNAQQIEQLAKLTNFCLRFPIFYPLIRLLFKSQLGKWIRFPIVRGLLLLRDMYVAYLKLDIGEKS